MAKKVSIVQFDHAAFMRNPFQWPNWPLLPIKRRVTGKAPDMAMLGEQGGGKYSIAVGANLFSDRSTWKWEPTTIDAVLAAGWEVD